MTDAIPTIQQPRRQRRWLFLGIFVGILTCGVVAGLLWRNGMIKDTIKQITGQKSTTQAFFTIDPEDCPILDRYDCAYALNCKPDVKKSPSCNGICLQEVTPGPEYLGCVALTDAELQQRSTDQAACEQIPGKSWHYGIGSYDSDDKIPSRNEACSCEYLVDATLFDEGPLVKPYTLVSLGTQVNKVYSEGCVRAKSVCESTGGSLVGPTLLSVDKRPRIDQVDCHVTEPWGETDPTLLVWDAADDVCEERTYQAKGGDLSFNCQTSLNEFQSDFEVINTNYFLYSYPTVIESE